MPSLKFQTSLTTAQDSLRNFAMHLTHNSDDAEDLLQDTTLKALDNADKYADGTNFKGWVFTIMRNVFINNYRRTSRANTIVDSTADLYHINSSMIGERPGPEGLFTVREITEAIKGLPDRLRMPFAMHVAGYRYKEIARKMGLPIGTVKSRIFLVRHALQERFADYCTA